MFIDPSLIIGLASLPVLGTAGALAYKKFKKKPALSKPEPEIKLPHLPEEGIHVLEIRGNPHLDCLTVTFGREGSPYRRITCIPIPQGKWIGADGKWKQALDRADLANSLGPKEVLDSLPKGWKEYLLSRVEARGI